MNHPSSVWLITGLLGLVVIGGLLWFGYLGRGKAFQQLAAISQLSRGFGNDFNADEGVLGPEGVVVADGTVKLKELAASGSFISNPISAGKKYPFITASWQGANLEHLKISLGPGGNSWCPVGNGQTIRTSDCEIRTAIFYYRADFTGPAVLDSINFEWSKRAESPISTTLVPLPPR